MDATAGRATLEFYKHDTRELGNELPTPSGLTTNVKLDLRTPAGSATVKQRMRAQLAWLMVEGMEVPVILDSAGLATKVDTDALETELAGHEDEIRATEKEQSSLAYSSGLPSREELGHVKELPGEAKKVFRGLRDAWRNR
jgi:hypothetical protein